MKANLIKLNDPLTAQGYHFKERPIQEAIKNTQFPVMAIQYRQIDHPLKGMMGGVEPTVADDALEFMCTSMWVEGEWLMGEIEFLTTTRLETHPDEYTFFARVYPRGNGIEVDGNTGSFHNFHFSSIGYREKTE